MKKPLLSIAAILVLALSIKAQVWTPITTNGFNEIYPNNVTAITGLKVFENKIYAGKGFNSTGQIYSSSLGNPNSWTKVFDTATSTSSYDYFAVSSQGTGFMYIGGNSNGNSNNVYRTDNGTSYSPYFDAGYNHVFGIIPFNGGGNGGAMDDSIYVMNGSGSTGSEIWKSNYNSNDPSHTSSAWVNVLNFPNTQFKCAAVYNNELYIGGMNSTTLLKTANGATFDTVILAWNANFPYPSGASTNTQGIVSIGVFGTKLFVGTKNSTNPDPAELWMYDGSSWYLMSLPTFNNPGTSLEITSIITSPEEDEMFITVSSGWNDKGVSILKTNDGVNFSFLLNCNNLGVPGNNGGRSCTEFFDHQLFFGSENLDYNLSTSVGGQLHRLDCPVNVLVFDPAGNVPLTSGTVVIYKDTSSVVGTYKLDTAAYTSINTNGNYTFSHVNEGDYWIKAYPDIAFFQDLIPTYYGNQFQWDSVKTTHVANHDNLFSIDSFDIDIIKLQAFTFGGPGKLRGRITEENGFHRTFGDPIPGVDIKLGRKPPGGNIIATAKSDTSININTRGWYEFTNLPYNATPSENYVIYVDIPGYGLISPREVHLDANNTQFLQLNYYVDTNTIFWDTNTYVGINNTVAKTNFNKLHVFPNPSNGNTLIKYYIADDAQVTLGIYNILGVRLEELVNKQQQAGEYTFKLDYANKYAPGTYFITLNANEKTTIYKMVITK